MRRRTSMLNAKQMTTQRSQTIKKNYDAHCTLSKSLVSKTLFALKRLTPKKDDQRNKT